MPIRIPWDEQETAILISACEDYNLDKISKKAAIETVSKKLRQRAINRGLTIDSIFRNENGITMQFMLINELITNEKSGLRGASKLFVRMVEMYKHDTDKFEKILKEAREMCNQSINIRDLFSKWLSEQFSPAQVSEIFITYYDIDEDLRNEEVLGTSLLEITRLDIIEGILNKLQIFHRYSPKYISAVKLYRDWLLHNEQFLSDDMEDAESENEEEKFSAINKENAIDDSNKEDTELMYVDYKKKGVYKNSQVIFFEYFGTREYGIETWSNLYEKVYQCLLDDYPHIINGQMSKAIGYSADAIVNKVGQLLKICNIDAEKLVIAYKYKNDESCHNQFRAAWGKYNQFSGDESFDTTSVKSETNNVDGKKENVALYMRLKSMASVYDDVHGYNIEWIKSMMGLSIDIEKLRTVLEDVSWITKVEEDVYSFSKNAKPFEKTIEFDKESFVRVLMHRYQSGMRFDSIDFDNFRETYADIVGEEINFTDKELEICLRKCGVLYQGRVFPAEGIVNKSARERLMEYITSSFASGKQILYYKSIYFDLTDVFEYCFNLTDAMMLKPYLEYVCEPDEYYFAEEYMTKEKNVKIDHSSEIEDFLLSMGKPLSYDEIYAGLSHISKEIIYNEIKSNPNIVLNERGHYYHYWIFEFTSEDADRISGFIGEDIEEDGYCIWSRVFVKIQKNMPLFIENNAYLTSIGIRNAVSKKLSGRFNFDGEVICNLGQFLSMAAVYRLYGEHKAPFSDDDIYKFSKEVSSGVIYFDSLSETVIRTSRKQFVNKNDVKFDVEEIDNALATYLSMGYMLIKDIDSFLVFPNVGYEWNAFLLESYLMYYSSKYTLLNNGRSLNNVAGALVRKGSGYDDFVEVCADVLANSDCVLTKQKALDYLADQNLLTRRSYSRIDSAIIKAKQIRNKEG